MFQDPDGETKYRVQGDSGTGGRMGRNVGDDMTTEGTKVNWGLNQFYSLLKSFDVSTT
jgi:hypothetical protein